MITELNILFINDINNEKLFSYFVNEPKIKDYFSIHNFNGKKVWICKRYHSLRLAPCSSPNLNFGIPGSHFATPELHFGGLGLPRGLPRGPLESKVDFGWILEFHALYLGTHVGTFRKNILKNHLNVWKTCTLKKVTEK